MLPRRPKATSLVCGSRFDADHRGAAASAFPAVGRRLVNRLRTRARRRLVGATPERRVHDLDGVARATVVGTVAGIAGDGPAVEVWRGEASAGDGRRGDGGRPVVGRATRPLSETLPFASVSRRPNAPHHHHHHQSGSTRSDNG